MSAEALIIAPLITEKGTIASEKANQVVFRVRPEATKDNIKLVVEEMFKVSGSHRAAGRTGREHRELEPIATERARPARGAKHA